MNHPVRLAILGSGNGTNAQQISEYFAGRTDVEVACIIYNKRDAYIAQRAKNLGIEARYFGRADFYDTNAVLDYLHEKQADWVILAGFLWLVPENMLAAYPNRIINIHPALLPSYGGKGMYGHHVHEAVKAAGESETGMTVHWVSPEVDGGEIIARFSTPLDPSDTPEDIAAKEHVLEMEHFPKVVEDTIVERFKLDRKAF
jgi:phosphoribosylglycinamide formyltransferase-1